MNNKNLYCISTENKDKQPNETHIYKHPMAIGKNPEFFLECHTLHDIYRKALENPNSQFLGERKKKNGKFENKFTWMTTQQVFNEAEQFGSGIVNLGIIPKIKEWNNMEFQFIGTFSINTQKLLITDIACGIYNLCIIPLYDTLGEEAINLAINQTNLNTLLISSKNVEKILKGKNKGLYQSIQNLILLDSENSTEDINDSIIKNSLKLFRYEDVLESGLSKIHPWADVTKDSIFAFSYTSGTTGDSKGAMISHQNICSVASNVKYRMDINSKDTYLSYLPMPHSLERCVFNSLIWLQARIGVYSGDPNLLMEDCKILKPTIFVSVPRIFNKMYDKVQQKINSSNKIVKSIVNKAVDKKITQMKKTNSKKNFLYDKLFLGALRKQFGGNLKCVLTGSAPISERVLDFLKVMLQCPVLEGYGQTEGCAFQFTTKIDDPFSGHVGGPIPHNEFKLVDVPDLNYLSTDKDSEGNPQPRGEVWIRGLNIIPGYYKLDDKNKETFTIDGWCKTGDIGQLIFPEGKLKIIDRKKNIFKLSQGEYIAPEKLENAYINTHQEISDIFVYGDSLKSCLIAVVSFTPQGLQKYAKEKNISGDKLEENEQLKNMLLKDIEEVRIQSKFNSLEKIRKLIISTKNWEEEGLITNTMKKKRNVIAKYYKEDIDKLYSDLDQFI